MADIDVRPHADEDEEDYTTVEIIYWTVGILMIPLTPILMIWFLTPWSGMN
jgi:hypothetical protein